MRRQRLARPIQLGVVRAQGGASGHGAVLRYNEADCGPWDYKEILARYCAVSRVRVRGALAASRVGARACVHTDAEMNPRGGRAAPYGRRLQQTALWAVVNRSAMTEA